MEGPGMISGSFTLELPHMTVSGFRHGRGPGVLYIHDELSSAWTPFLDVLADMFEVTSIELPGFGTPNARSGPRPSRTTPSSSPTS